MIILYDTCNKNKIYLLAGICYIESVLYYIKSQNKLTNTIYIYLTLRLKHMSVSNTVQFVQLRKKCLSVINNKTL